MLRHLCTFLTLLSLSLVVCASAQGTSWYADPNGLAANTGAINSPWDLKTALCKHSTIQPGDTLYLRGGTYHTYWGYNLDGYECIWRSSLAGSANAPIKVMSYPGEWAILDSGVGTLVNWVTLEVYGQYTWFQNLEIMDSNPTRYDTSTDTWTVSSGKNAGIEMGAGDPAVVGYTPGLKCINCLIHDTTCGMDIYRAGSGAEAYGNIISYNGWEGADRAHGHGLYTQNSGGADGNQFDNITDNIVFDSFEFGIHAYGGGASQIFNYNVLRNISFQNGSIRAGNDTADIILVNGGAYTKKNITCSNNWTYTPSTQIGGGNWLGWQWDFSDPNYLTHPNLGFNINVVCQNNHFIGGNPPLQIAGWAAVTCTGNTILSNPNATFNILCLWGDNESPTNYTWDYNTYIARAPYWKGCVAGGSTQQSFAGWQAATGFDVHGTSSATPSGTAVGIYPNYYDSGRANIAICNWTGANSVSVDLSSLNMITGSAYQIYDAQNYVGSPLVTGTWNGSAVSIPLANSDGSALPLHGAIGNVTVAPKHTLSDFGIYVIKFTSGPPQHQKPYVFAGLNQTISAPANSVSLVGAASDDNISPAGTLVTTWSKTSGPGTVTFANANALSTTATFSTLGTYVLNLDANDGNKDSNSQCAITYVPASANTAPTVTAGSNQTIAMPVAAGLTGTVSDDGLPNPPGQVVLTWTKVSGPGTVIFGTPTAALTNATFSTAGTYVLQLDANDSSLHTSATTTVTVIPYGATSGPYGGTPWPVPCQIEGENYDNGGEGIAYHDTTAGNAGAVYRTDDVDIRATTDTGGGYLIKQIANGEWLKYTVNIPSAGNYNISVRTATTVTGGTMHIECDGTNVTGTITVPPGSDYDNGTTTTVNNCSLPAGQHVMRVYFDTANYNFNWFSITSPGGGANTAPTVSAGSTQTILWPTNSVSLSGTVSDDGLPNPPAACVLAWTKTSGPGTVTFSAPTAASTNATFSTIGTYVLNLDANDSAMKGDSTVTIIVSAANAAPTVTAASDQQITIPTGTVNLSGTVSDDGLPNPPGSCVLSWTKTSGPGTVTFASPNALSTKATFAADGTYVLNLDANDSSLHGDATVTVIVDAAPTVNAGADQQIQLPTNTATLTATASDDNWPAALTYQWTKSSGPGTVTFATPTAASTTATFSTVGTYSLMIAVSDSLLSAEDLIVVVVYPTNTAPTVSAGSNQSIGWPTDTVSLSGTVSDDGLPLNKTLVIQWTKSSGPGNVLFANANAASTTVTFSTVGTYVLNLDANDGALKTDSTCTITVSAANASPTVTGLSNQTITMPTNSVSLSGTVSDDGLPSACVLAWTKVSGPGTVTFSAPTSASTNATFSTVGTYVLNLDANDSVLHGDQAVTITVKAANTAPTVMAGSNQQIMLPTTSVSLSGTVSDDGLPSGTTTCTWSKDSGPGTVTFANANAAATTATFSTVGTYVLRLTASDTALQAYSTVTITVAASGGGSSMRIQAEDYDLGGQYVAYYDSTAGNAGGAYRNDDVDIRTTTDDPNGYAVCYIVNGEWLNYTRTIPASGSYSAKFRTSNTTGNEQTPVSNAIHLYCDGVDVTPAGGINLPGTLGPEYWATTTVTGVNLPAGQHVLRISITNGANTWDFNWFEIDSATGSGNTAPTVGVGSNQQISWPTNTVSLSGTVSDDGLPSGTTTCTWSKDSGLGTVTFTNANAASTTATFSTTGTYVLRLTASDTALQGYGTVTITVLPGNTAPTVSAGNNQITFLPTTSVTLAGTVSDDGLPVGSTTTCTWSKDSGPGTVTFGNANAAATTATFSTVGTYVLRLTASDTALQAYSTVTITVSASSGWSLRIQAEDYDTGGQGVAYNDTTAGNGGGAYRNDDVDIRSTTDDPNGYAVCYISSPEWLNYTETIPSSGSYTLKVRTSCLDGYNGQTNAFHLLCDGTDVTPNGVDLPWTLGPEYWATTIVQNVSLPAGQHVLKISVRNGSSWDFNWFELDAQ